MRDVVLGFCKSENIEIESTQGERGDVLNVAFAGETGRLSGVLHVDENIGVLTVYSLCPVRVTPPRTAAALELVARLNFGHMLGNLEIDVDSGLIRFKTSIDVEGEELTDGLVANCVYANIASMEQMLPAIRAVVVEEVDVRAALRTMVS